MEYYTYTLIDPRTDEPFYVGRGQKLRMYEHVKDVQRGRIPNKNNRKLANKINKILSFNLNVKYKKILITENGKEAFNKEKELITEIGLENLCNLTEGGEGFRGKHTEETKRKISEATKGENNPFFAKSHTEETKQKISKNNARYFLGKKLPEETKQKISKSNKGRIFSDKHRKKLSESLKGRKLSEEHKRKISESRKIK